jgi:hypothetical protein
MIDLSRMVAPCALHSVKLSSIRDGTAIEEIKAWGDTPLDSNANTVYKNWLSKQ